MPCTRPGVIACCLVVLVAHTAVEAQEAPTPTAGPAVGDNVRVKTAGAVVEGVLIDKVPTGYLVRGAEGSVLIPYDQVETIEVVAAPAAMPDAAGVPAVPADPVAPPPPGPKRAPVDMAKLPRERWPMTATFQYVFGLQAHALSMGISGSGQTASFRPPESDVSLLPSVTMELKPWFGVGMDFLMNVTSAQQVAPGTEGCIDVGCFLFPDGVSHNTFTLMPTIWAKYLRDLAKGRARLWGGAGVNLAWVNYNYDHYGAGSDVGVSFALGAGGDYRLPLGSYQLVFSTSLALGSPVYDENIDGFVFSDNVYTKGDVGHAVPAWRFGLGVGIGFPIRSR